MKSISILNIITGIICLIILCLPVQAQDTTAWKKIAEGRYDALQKAGAAEKLAFYFEGEKQYSRAIGWAEKGLAAARESNNDSLLFGQYSLLSLMQEKAGYMEDAIATLEQYLLPFGQSHKSVHQAIALNNIGVLYGKLNDYARQTEYYIRAQSMYEALGRQAEAAEVAVNLAQVYANTGNLREAVHNLRLLLADSSVKAPKNEILCNIYGTLAYAYKGMKKTDSAFYFSDLEIAAARRTNNPALLFTAWQKKGGLLVHAGQPEAAKAANDSMLYYAQKNSDPGKEGIAYSNLGMYYAFVTGGMPQARDYFEKALAVSQQTNDLKFRVNCLNNLAAAYNALGQHDKAFSFQEKAYQLLKDSLITNAGQEKVAEMQARFQAERKEAKIKLLDEKNKLQTRTTYFLIAGLGLFAVLCFSLYRNAQSRKKANQKLSALNQSLEEANATKAKLFSILSHDLRSPISQVYQYLRLQQTESTVLNAEQKKSFNHKIQTATASLLETMEDLLLWSKTQLNQFEVKKKIVRLSEPVEECTRLLQLNIEAKNLKVKTTVSEQDSVTTDAYFLQTILRNLLQNAIKATPENSTISIRFEDNQLLVENEGAAFTQSDYEQALSSNGEAPLSGLGLKLVAELSEKINAQIRFGVTRGGTTVARIIF